MGVHGACMSKTTPHEMITSTIETTSKSILRSKTFWVQATTLLSLAFPAVRLWLETNPESFVAVFAAVNVLVRFATSGAVSIFPDGVEKKPSGDGGASGGKLPLALLLCGTLAGIMGCLPACSNGVPLRIKLSGPDGMASYSSKGGLAVDYRTPN